MASQPPCIYSFDSFVFYFYFIVGPVRGPNSALERLYELTNKRFTRLIPACVSTSKTKQLKAVATQLVIMTVVRKGRCRDIDFWLTAKSGTFNTGLWHKGTFRSFHLPCPFIRTLWQNTERTSDMCCA